MQYYFNINGTEFNASDLKITGVYRKENVQTNLAGGLLIDRIGEEKLKLSVKLNLLTQEQMLTLRAARASVTCTATFDRGDDRVEKQMHIAQFTEPSPIYFYGNKEQGFLYGSLTITMEEV